MARRRLGPMVVERADSGYQMRNPGPLVLAEPILEQMHIREIVDQYCPADVRLEVPIGTVVHALVANRLSSPEPLMHVAQWGAESGAELLLGIPGEALNDDRLGRALDAVFTKRWNILAEVALHVSARFKVRLSQVHYDPTSFHFTGEYDHQWASPSLLPEIRPFRIEVGRHAGPGKDIKEAQVGVNLANDGRGPVPFFYHSIDGSANGHQAVAKNLQHLTKFLKPKRLLLVSDRGCFSAEHALRIADQKFHFVSSITWQEELGRLYRRQKPAMKEASFLSLAERRKREAKKPRETWEYHYIGEVPYTLEHKGRRLRVRVIFVLSSADRKVCQKMRQKYTARIKEGLQRIQRSVRRGYLTEEAAVHKNVAAVYGRKQAQRYFNYSVRPLTPEERQATPRRRGQRLPILKFSFSYHPRRAKQDAQNDGLFALMTNLPPARHSTDQVFTTFKEQHHIETAHHQWKAPIRLRPLFLKKVRRLESLVFVQFLALMAFYLLQRLYRLSQEADCRTTAETLFRRFALCPLGIREQGQLLRVLPASPEPAQEETLRALGFPSLEKQLRAAARARFALD